jgi:tetratricopeptide (TPR) repeat protein
MPLRGPDDLNSDGLDPVAPELWTDRPRVLRECHFREQSLDKNLRFEKLMDAFPGAKFLPRGVAPRPAGRLNAALCLDAADPLAQPHSADPHGADPHGTDSHSADEEYLRGVQCQDENRPTEAFRHFQRSLALRAAYAPAHNNLGVIRQQWGQLDAAAAAYLEAIQANPQFGLAWCNLGNCFREDNRLDDAIEFYRRAQALMPTDGQTRINLAVALRDLRRFDEALALLDEIPTTSPDFPKARFNRSLIHLLRGEIGPGWDEYEGRLEAGVATRPIPTVRWNGAPLAGRSILLLAEQGIGDQVMFASCLPELLNGAGRSFIECDPRLVPLFARSFPDCTATANPPDSGTLPPVGSCEVTEFLGTLPRFLRRRIQDFPQTTGYLRPDPALVAKWRSSLTRLGSVLKVGISWSGGKEAETRRRRSIPLELWRPIFQVPGVRFVNIQYGPAAAEASQARRQFGIALDDGTDCDPLSNLDDFAAKLAALDLVLTVDNSTAHLAAALGQPVWTLLPFAADWRWMLDRETTPWYPTMRLLRCPAADHWLELLQRTARLLTSATFSRDLLTRTT